jgi:hypothetical protein
MTTRQSGNARGDASRSRQPLTFPNRGGWYWEYDRSVEVALAYAGLREEDRTETHREQMRKLLEWYPPGEAVMIFKDSPISRPQASNEAAPDPEVAEGWPKVPKGPKGKYTVTQAGSASEPWELTRQARRIHQERRS